MVAYKLTDYLILKKTAFFYFIYRFEDLLALKMTRATAPRQHMEKRLLKIKKTREQ